MLLDRQNGLLSPRFAILFSLAFALLLFTTYNITVYRESGGAESILAGGNHLAHPNHLIPKPNKKVALADTIQQLFAPIKHNDFFSAFKDPSGTVYKNQHKIWTEPLGKDLLILDVDTRYPEQMFDPKKGVDWEHLETDNLVTEAVFNHYLYAKIHGYDYHFYRPEWVEGHHKTWPKVHSIHDMLPNYKMVVFLDADATFRHLNLPFEWLLNRWNVTKNTSFTMARDPLDDDCNLCDSNGIPMVNTGFVITQNLPYTEEIFDVWMKCTSGETQYKDCAKWKEQWAHEQAVMSDYLRYDYNPDGDNIRELECGEANGFPGHMWYDPVGCNGKFIRHHTFVKHMTKETTANAVMQAFVDIMKDNFENSPADIVLNESDRKGKKPPKNPDTKKPEEPKKPEEQKKPEEKKPEEQKPEEQKKPEENKGEGQTQQQEEKKQDDEKKDRIEVEKKENN